MITLTREEAQQVLDALEELNKRSIGENAICLPAEIDEVMETLRARLSEPEPEPIAYLCENAVGHKYFRWKKPQSVFKPIALYTAPPQREWVGLTDEELLDLADMAYTNDLELLQTLQAKLKEKNT